MAKRPEYRWDRSAGRYKGPDGRFVAESKVRLWLDVALDAATGRIDGLANALRAGTLDPISWEVAMRREIKNVALYSAASAKGGWAQMTEADYGRAGQYVRDQYEYLHNFYREVKSGIQPLDGRLNARAQLYGQAGRPLFHRFEIAEKALRGANERRNLRYKGDSCAGCLEAAGRGWVPINDKTTPEIGQRECRTRCRCRWEFRPEVGTAEPLDAARTPKEVANVDTVAGPAPATIPAIEGIGAAKSQEEALGHFQQLGVQAAFSARRVGVGNTTLRGGGDEFQGQVLQILNDSAFEFAEAARRGAKLPTRVIFGESRAGMASYVHGDETIYITVDSHVMRTLSEQMPGFYSQGWFSTGEARHVYAHELVHADHYLAGAGKKVKKKFTEYRSEAEVEIARKVSEYATTNPMELVAEVGTGIRFGKTYPDEVMNLYNFYWKGK